MKDHPHLTTDHISLSIDSQGETNPPIPGPTPGRLDPTPTLTLLEPGTR